MSKELQDGLNLMRRRGVDTFPAVVVSVDKANGTCVVNDGTLDYTDVRLSASVEDEGKRFYLFPKVGSWVLVSPINEDIHRLYIEFFSEIESIDLKIEETQLKVDKKGFLLKKENETLKALMVDLLQEIQKMKFTTYAGGPTLTLLNKPKFIEIENRFKKFLKED